MLWKEGVPKFILRLIGNKLIKLSTKKMTPRFVQLNFCNADPSLSPRSSTSSRLLSLQPSRRSSRTSTISSRRSSKKTVVGNLFLAETVPYKAIMREKDRIRDTYPSRDRFPAPAPYRTNTKLLNDKDLFVILSTWTREQLKRVQTIHAYTRLAGVKQSVIRVHVVAPLMAAPQVSERILEGGPLLIPKDTTKHRVTMCKEICRRVCQSIARSTDVEIFEITAEFMVTELEYMLDDAWDIVWKRRDPPPQSEAEKDLPYAMNSESLLKLVLKLDKKEEKIDCQKAVKVGDICTRIDKHVRDIRQMTGVNDGLKEDPKDGRSDTAFARLRPLCPYNMTDLLRPRFDITHHLSPSTFSPHRILGLTQAARRLPREDLVRALLYSENGGRRQVRCKTRAKERYDVEKHYWTEERGTLSTRATMTMRGGPTCSDKRGRTPAMGAVLTSWSSRKSHKSECE